MLVDKGNKSPFLSTQQHNNNNVVDGRVGEQCRHVRVCLYKENIVC